MPLKCFTIPYLTIGVTGNALPADMALFRASGVDQILLKPLNRAQFVSELLLIVDRSI
jgi:hypothetical protein